ncbi:MAG: hypothetical protein ACIAXF_16020 [Phycisphaerales bacterium JB063]
MKYRPLAATAAVTLAVVFPAQAQSRSERADDIAELLASSVSVNGMIEEEQTASPARLMREVMSNVDLDQVPAQLALEMWSVQTNVPLVINWAALEEAGIDPEAPVTLQLRRVPADVALKLMLRQINPNPIGDDELILQTTEWYAQVMTKREALQNSTTQMYFIGDLLMEIPNFEGPEFDLNEALSNTNSGGSNNGGGGGGGGGGDLFGDDNDQPEEDSLSREERAEQIADIIRDTIEPEIWKANGGEYASVRYFRGMLVVKAPQYVHDQIGVPTTGPAARSSRAADRSSRNTDQGARPHRDNSDRTNGVSGTSRPVNTIR